MHCAWRQITSLKLQLRSFRLVHFVVVSMHLFPESAERGLGHVTGLHSLPSNLELNLCDPDYVITGSTINARQIEISV